VDLGDQVDGGQARLAQPLLRQVDERGKIQVHGVALDHDALTVPGEHRDHLAVGHPDRLVPHRRELRTGHQLGDLVADEPRHRGCQGRCEGAQPVDQLRWQTLGGQRVDGVVREPLHVDVLEDRHSQPVGQGALHIRVRDQGSHRADEPIGVGDLVVHPDRDACDGSEYAAENDQHNRQQRPPAELPSPRARGRVERLDLAAQTKEFSAFIGGQRLPRGGLNRGRFQLGHRRHLRESSGDGSLAARTSAAITSPG